MNSIKALCKLSLSLLLAVGLFGASAYAQVNIYVSIAPPPLQQEIVPIVSPGYIWAPGYWAWNGDRHIWVPGREIHQRAGYRWESDRWDERDGRYYRTAGSWRLDGFHPAKHKKEKKQKKEKDHEGRGKHHGDNHRD